jgi:hypothetical protein
VSAATAYAKKAATLDAAGGRRHRQLTVLKNTMTMAAPADPVAAAELISWTAMAAYGRGKYCPSGEARGA